MKKSICAFLLILFPAFFFSQELSPLFKSGNKTVDQLAATSREQMLNDKDNLNALKTADKAKQIAISDNDKLAMAKANAAISWIFLDNKNLDAAENFAEKALKNIQGEEEAEAEAVLHHQIGIILDEKSEPKKALEHYLKAVKYYTDTKNYFRQAQVNNEISRLYLITGDKDSFNKYFSLTEKILKTHPNARLQLSYNNQMNFVLMEQRKFEEAYKINMESAALALKTGEKKFVNTSYYNAAGALFEQGKEEEAMVLVDKAIDYAKKNKIDYTEQLVGKAQIFLSQGKKKEAEQLFLSTINELRKNKDKFMEMQARKLLMNYYIENKNNEAAAEQLLITKNIEDSIASVNQSIALKEVEYQYKDQEKEDLLESYKTSAIQKNLIIILSTILSLVALYLFFNLRKNMKLRQTLFDKKEKLLENEKKNAIIEKELAVQKQEKAVLNEKLLQEEKQRIELEKQNTDRELASITLYVQEKNKMLEDLQGKMRTMLENTSDESRSKLLEISKNIKQNINFEKDWDKIKLHFEKVHPDFFVKLSEICPQLTQNELKHCAYIKMNMSNKETSNLLGVDHNTVKMSRYRIKKKLNLSQEEDLTQFIQAI